MHYSPLSTIYCINFYVKLIYFKDMRVKCCDMGVTLALSDCFCMKESIIFEYIHRFRTFIPYPVVVWYL